MAAPKAELSRLQRIMGHASPETTSRYVHHYDHELAAEHRRIERLQRDQLARRQERRQERAATRGYVGQRAKQADRPSAWPCKNLMPRGDDRGESHQNESK
jgi:hypothetical protein